MSNYNLKKSVLTALTFSLVGFSVLSNAEPGERFYILSKHSGKCVQQHGANQNDGGNVTQWECLNQDNVKLEKIDVGSGNFMLRFPHSGKCVTVPSNSAVNNSNVTQWNCDFRAPRNQTWTTVKSIDPNNQYVKIKSTLGSCLQQEGNTLVNGGNISLWDCANSQPNLQWQFITAP